MRPGPSVAAWPLGLESSMKNDAQSRATEKYRRENVKSFNVKFFPGDADLLEWFQGQENKNRYLKNLIRADMEGRVTMGVRHYVFESANMGDIEIEVTGEYVDGGKDIEARIVESDQLREFTDLDGGGAEDIFEWLMDRGVGFACDASLWFNVHYVASVMIDGDATRESLLAEVDGMAKDELNDWRAFTFDK